MIIMEEQFAVQHTPTQRNIDVFSPIKFGFSRTFKNASFWIPFALLNMVIMFGGLAIAVLPVFFQLQDSPNNEPDLPISTIIVYIAMIIILFVLGIMGMRQAIRDVSAVGNDNKTIIQDKTPASWNTLTRDIAWGKIIATMLLVVVIAGLIGGILGSAIGFVMSNVISGETVNTGVVIASMLFTIVVYLVIFAISTLIAYSSYFATDPETNVQLSPVDCIKKSFYVVKDNFWIVFGFNIVLAIITSFIALLTLGIGFFVAIPVSLLAQAYMFRTLVGLYAPVQ